jgi:hypothetical protein
VSCAGGLAPLGCTLAAAAAGLCCSAFRLCDRNNSEFLLYDCIMSSPLTFQPPPATLAGSLQAPRAPGLPVLWHLPVPAPAPAC